MTKGLSCGFLLQDSKTGLFLGCMPTGHKDGIYDIPKGGMDEGETFLECAVRELMEETGITEITNVTDLGHTPYNKYKDLHLFLAYADIDISKLHCDSMFESNGKMIPEMSGYKLGDITMFSKNMQTAILNVLKH